MGNENTVNALPGHSLFLSRIMGNEYLRRNYVALITLIYQVRFLYFLVVKTQSYSWMWILRLNVMFLSLYSKIDKNHIYSVQKSVWREDSSTKFILNYIKPTFLQKPLFDRLATLLECADHNYFPTNRNQIFPFQKHLSAGTQHFLWTSFFEVSFG